MVSILGRIASPQNVAILGLLVGQTGLTAAWGQQPAQNASFNWAISSSLVKQDQPPTPDGTNQAPPQLPPTVVEGDQTTAPQPAPTPPPPEPSPFDTVFNNYPDGPYLNDVQGTRIYGGKKTVNIQLDDLPPISNSNFRQALIKAPGLLLSEESSPLFSVGYRGLAPHRAQFMQILKDGIPIHADMFGYPEAYYVPPLQFIDHIDFIHGGASLMYGPQPGGALNFVTREPNPDALVEPFSEQLFGSHNFFSTSNAVSGTSGNLGYYVYQHHRESDGFRSANSDFRVDYGGAKFIFNLSPTGRLITTFDLYQEAHGEPGGLTRAAFFGAGDNNTATRLNDRFNLDRYSASMRYQEQVFDNVLFETALWGTYYRRFSRRQRGGMFGTPPAGGTSGDADFELQEFFNIGIEPRLRCDWGDQNQHTLSVGTMFYHTDSPRRDTRDFVFLPDSLGRPGQRQRLNQRETNYFSVFAENRFDFGQLSVTPGMRMENIWLSLREDVNTDKMLADLSNEEDHDFEPLFGLGVAYDFENDTQAYFNISQAYRPKIFTQAIALAPGESLAGDLQPGNSYQVDIGYRGQPAPWFNWDMSLFYLEFNNQIGTLAGVIQNVGDSVHQGFEASVQMDLVGWSDEVYNRDLASRVGAFSLFYNMMLLDAEFKSGPAIGNTPQFAPDYLIRAGVVWDYSPRTRIQFSGTTISDHFGDDGNSALFFMPSYTVCDVSTEFQIYESLSVVAGVNNVFDEFYTARIRSDGIDPADGRNYYLGGRLAY